MCNATVNICSPLIFLTRTIAKHMRVMDVKIRKKYLVSAFYHSSVAHKKRGVARCQMRMFAGWQAAVDQLLGHWAPVNSNIAQ